MVKKAFLDDSLTHHNLTSANSINIARWLPQMFYFFFAYKELKKENKELVFSCPSGISEISVPAIKARLTPTSLCSFHQYK
jgi:threonine synthase